MSSVPAVCCPFDTDRQHIPGARMVVSFVPVYTHTHTRHCTSAVELRHSALVTTTATAFRCSVRKFRSSQVFSPTAFFFFCPNTKRNTDWIKNSSVGLFFVQVMFYYWFSCVAFFLWLSVQACYDSPPAPPSPPSFRCFSCFTRHTNTQITKGRYKRRY